MATESRCGGIGDAFFPSSQHKNGPHPSVGRFYFSTILRLRSVDVTAICISSCSSISAALHYESTYGRGFMRKHGMKSFRHLTIALATLLALSGCGYNSLQGLDEQ